METIQKEQLSDQALIRLLMDFGPLTLDRPLSREAFADLSDRFPALQMERNQDGKVIIMSPTKPGSGKREAIVIFYVTAWWQQHKQGEPFSSSTGIELPSGATKSPDCAWVSSQRMRGIRPKDLEATYLKVVPDFVVEICSQYDRLERLQQKMTDDWMANGVRLAWLIDPYQEKVYIYRENGRHETLSGFAGHALDGEDVLPGMKLPLEELRIGE